MSVSLSKRSNSATCNVIFLFPVVIMLTSSLYLRMLDILLGHISRDVIPKANVKLLYNCFGFVAFINPKSYSDNLRSCRNTYSGCCITIFVCVLHAYSIDSSDRPTISFGILGIKIYFAVFSVEQPLLQVCRIQSRHHPKHFRLWQTIEVPCRQDRQSRYLF